MLEKIIRDFMTIWTTIDPISNLALFAGLTAAMPRTERRRIAWRASLYAALILVVAVVISQIVLDAMGIRLRSLQVAGGLILQHPLTTDKEACVCSSSDIPTLK
jgi:multiple antibiotic resistance protein